MTEVLRGFTEVLPWGLEDRKYLMGQYFEKFPLFRELVTKFPKDLRHTRFSSLHYFWPTPSHVVCPTEININGVHLRAKISYHDLV